MIYVVVVLLLYVCLELHLIGNAARMAAMRARVVEMKVDAIRQHLGHSLLYIFRRLDENTRHELGSWQADEQTKAYGHAEDLTLDAGKTDVDDLVPELRKRYRV